MKLQGRVPMIAGEWEIFSPDLAQKMIGQTTKDGWIVVDAKNEGRKTIWLTIEKENNDI